MIWASKFSTAKIECCFENGQVNTFGGTIYFAADGTSGVPHGPVTENYRVLLANGAVGVLVDYEPKEELFYSQIFLRWHLGRSRNVPNRFKIISKLK